jgi:hypothetical protein
MEFWKVHHKFWDNLISGEKKHIHTLYNKITLSIMVLVSQRDGIIHILAVRDSVKPWWPNITIKLNLRVCVETPHTDKHKCSFRGPNTWKRYICIFRHEQFYWWWMRHAAASNFWLHSLTTPLLTFFCPCFAHIEPQPRSTTPPALCSIPFTCTHWIQNRSEACAWDDTKYALLQMPHKQGH